MTLAIRLVLFAVVGGLGLLVGSFAGSIVGGLIEFATQQPAGEQGAVVYAYSWGGAWLGGLIGFFTGIMWLGTQMGKRS